MNGIHDMGGMDGFGRVESEADEPAFHAPWEGRVMAMIRAMGFAGAWNLDMFRAARESQPAHVYLTSSYYRSWALALETLALSRGFVGADEIAVGRSLHPARPLPRPVLRVAQTITAIRRAAYERPAAAPALFRPGDRVRAANIHPSTHTRLPRYVRGREGVVERWLGAQVYPDSSALGLGENPQHLYTIVFDGQELWGAGSDPTVTVSIDAFEPYLEAA